MTQLETTQRGNERTILGGGWEWKGMVMGVMCDGHFAFRAKRG